MPLDEDDPELEPASNSIVYDLAPGQPISSDVPEWIQNQIMRCQEWQEATKAPARSAARPGKPAPPPESEAAEDEDDDTPAYVPPKGKRGAAAAAPAKPANGARRAKAAAAADDTDIPF